MHVFHIVMGLPYSEKHRVSQNTFCQYLLMKALTDGAAAVQRPPPSGSTSACPVKTALSAR